MERSAYFDNAKLMLIFLVVFGHVIQPFTIDSTGVNTLYMWIYTFHMPAFIFLAGFFAKGAGNKDYLFKLTRKLLLPYLIFQLIYSSYYYYIGKPGWLTDLSHPHWSLWFLFSLFCWHILLYWFKKIPAVASVVLAITIGLVVGYFPEIGHQFSLSRTFVFFPFFLLGYLVTSDHVMWLKHRSVKVASVIIMAIVAVAIYVAPEFNSGWLLASKSYGDLGMPEYGGLARLLVYATSAIMAVSVLTWVPTQHYRFTKLGTRTLYVYLLHGFFIQYFRQAELFYVNNVLDLFGLAVISAVIVLVLSSRPIQGISQPFIEGKASILKKYVASREG
ncbi:acyltransferase family protein [Ornithinibacillus sp. L9]|uniref:Acyltransferase family protein n=1 Tax=Ornithinibacillus caprae TaxID=2678566 RepID=A0A6N8FQ03_9BACI|nr:acyltransferase family protein [Ornithinibacillus caprae]MUK89598.1 acyltransferase family protein [Ornithinibacillus caprae]